MWTYTARVWTRGGYRTIDTTEAAITSATMGLNNASIQGVRVSAEDSSSGQAVDLIIYGGANDLVVCSFSDPMAPVVEYRATTTTGATTPIVMVFQNVGLEVAPQFAVAKSQAVLAIADFLSPPPSRTSQLTWA